MKEFRDCWCAVKSVNRMWKTWLRLRRQSGNYQLTKTCDLRRNSVPISNIIVLCDEGELVRLLVVEYVMQTQTDGNLPLRIEDSFTIYLIPIGGLRVFDIEGKRRRNSGFGLWKSQWNPRTELVPSPIYCPDSWICGLSYKVLTTWPDFFFFLILVHSCPIEWNPRTIHMIGMN